MQGAAATSRRLRANSWSTTRSCHRSRSDMIWPGRYRVTDSTRAGSLVADNGSCDADDRQLAIMCVRTPGFRRRKPWLNDQSACAIRVLARRGSGDGRDEHVNETIGDMPARHRAAARVYDEHAAAIAAPSGGALTGDQQTRRIARCVRRLGVMSRIPRAGPSALSDPTVMTTAASSFAGSTSLPLSSATDMLKGYVAQHATDILASCATSSVTSGVTSKIPGAGSLPSVPNMP